MTLIIGIKCSNGIVVGADGAATLTDPLGTTGTVLQPVSKLVLLHNRIIIGVSGPLGLAQLFTDRIDQLWKGKQLGRVNSLPQTMRIMARAIAEDAKVALQAAALASNVVGPPARIPALTSTLVALPIAGKPELIQFDYQCNSEAATGDLAFVSIGSGQQIADPFLAFLRRIFWPRPKLPSLADGIFAAVWTLEHAIETNPGGVADPIQIAVLEYQKNELVARELGNAELDEHRQLKADAERYLARFPEEHKPTDKEEEPPTPPAEPPSLS